MVYFPLIIKDNFASDTPNCNADAIAITKNNMYIDRPFGNQDHGLLTLQRARQLQVAGPSSWSLNKDFKNHALWEAMVEGEESNCR